VRSNPRRTTEADLIRICQNAMEGV